MENYEPSSPINKDEIEHLYTPGGKRESFLHGKIDSEQDENESSMPGKDVEESVPGKEQDENESSMTGKDMEESVPGKEQDENESSMTGKDMETLTPGHSYESVRNMCDGDDYETPKQKDRIRRSRRNEHSYVPVQTDDSDGEHYYDSVSVSKSANTSQHNLKFIDNKIKLPVRSKAKLPGRIICCVVVGVFFCSALISIVSAIVIYHIINTNIEAKDRERLIHRVEDSRRQDVLREEINALRDEFSEGKNNLNYINKRLKQAQLAENISGTNNRLENTSTRLETLDSLVQELINRSDIYMGSVQLEINDVKAELSRFQNIWSKELVSLRANDSDALATIKDTNSRLETLDNLVQELKNHSDLNCTFDVDMCGWRQSDTDDFDWTRRNGTTSSSDTGPNSDHTSGHGYYYYTETSDRIPGDSAVLISPTLPCGQDLCLQLYTNMYGATMGQIVIGSKSCGGTIMVLARYTTADSSAIWRERNIDIPAQTAPFTVQITGTRGSYVRSDAAIDDVTIKRGKC